MMIKVLLQGGLGNQMFQYAFARALAHRGFSVGLDASFNYVTLKSLRADRAKNTLNQNLIGGGAAQRYR
ncbi:hypothetical protein [Helicobacter sp.]|uniref:hypothetical protein n=1 Tax=Helicobacter sp. TaxID=218 RepID=UPI0025C64986|nr:hypothetical protein [Helicobacter sp.]MBR2494184.1 hypothetical protein [Helicobacter sp.]